MNLYEIIGRQIEELFLINAQKEELKKVADEHQEIINILSEQIQTLQDENECLKRINFDKEK